MGQLTNTIRAAVEASNQTRYRIAKESGVSAGQLSRLVMGEREMTVDTLERLAEHLGLRIVVVPKTKRKGA